MDSSRPSQPPNPVKILYRRRVHATSTENLGDSVQYTRLKDSLTNTQTRLTDIRINLNDPQLTDAEARKLFGSIRKSVLDAIWQHRSLEEWVFRCTRMGSEHAQTMAQEGAAAAYALRIEFYAEQDYRLEMSGGTRGEVVEMILQHVGVYRDAVVGVERLQGEKERLLEAEREEAVGGFVG